MGSMCGRVHRDVTGSWRGRRLGWPGGPVDCYLPPCADGYRRLGAVQRRHRTAHSSHPRQPAVGCRRRAVIPLAGRCSSTTARRAPGWSSVMARTCAAERGLRSSARTGRGYGSPRPQPGRTVADSAADVRTICTELGIDRLVTWGDWGCGPHVPAWRRTTSMTLACSSPTKQAARKKLDMDREGILAASPDDVAREIESMLSPRSRSSRPSRRPWSQYHRGQRLNDLTNCSRWPAHRLVDGTWPMRLPVSPTCR
jgi:hypothetical protein